MGIAKFVKGEIELKTRRYIIDVEKIKPSDRDKFAGALKDMARFAKVKVDILANIWPRFTVEATGKKKRLKSFEEQLGAMKTATYERVEKPSAFHAMAAVRVTYSMLTVGGYSKKYGVPEGTVRKWCAKGVLKTEKDRRPYMIPDVQGKPYKNPETDIWVFVMPDGSVRR